MLPRSEAKHLVVRGTIPHVLPRQTLRLFVAGHEIGRMDFGPGDFVFEADAPADLSKDAVEILLEAEYAFVPSRCGMGPDPRRLSYMLREISVG
jgi:hypothetical protein